MAIAAAGEADNDAVTGHLDDTKIPSTIIGDKTSSPVISEKIPSIVTDDEITLADAEAVTDHLPDAKTPRTVTGNKIPSTVTGNKRRSGGPRVIIDVRVARMILISFLVVLFSPLLLRRQVGDPLILMWTIALLICTYLDFLTSTIRGQCVPPPSSSAYPIPS
ncbi:hypothetical protein E2562_025598 [Oryza meyeriana var. granulata]|uniref:Uncharacterized protein n=1 Tax=Oryza meyeriana var. granulata TaxID=110450 RepID=A0A6G1E1J4_9ORYZ|nr:hypothetical protein E2562_025598 [Oryza meyeriana var. granulata]